MKSKPYLKNTEKAALLFSLAFYLTAFLCGCLQRFEPTFKEKEIPDAVKEICKKEYDIEVMTKRLPHTLWVYAPLPKIFHAQDKENKESFFEDEAKDKLRNMINVIGRVLVSSDNTPEFFALLATDKKLRIDYLLIANVMDIKKTYAGSIPWTESSRRYVIKLTLSNFSKETNMVEYFDFYDITLAEFLTKQTVQRIEERFREEGLKDYIGLEECNGRFENNNFIFEYATKEKTSPEKQISAMKEIINIFTYCAKAYEFKDFSSVLIKNLITQDKIIFKQTEVLARPIP